MNDLFNLKYIMEENKVLATPEWLRKNTSRKLSKKYIKSRNPPMDLAVRNVNELYNKVVSGYEVKRNRFYSKGGNKYYDNWTKQTRIIDDTTDPNNSELYENDILKMGNKNNTSVLNTSNR